MSQENEKPVWFKKHWGYWRLRGFLMSPDGCCWIDRIVCYQSLDLNWKPLKSNDIKGTSAIDAAALTTYTAIFDAIGATTAVINRLSLPALFAAAYFDAVPICELMPSAATASLSLPSTFERTRQSIWEKYRPIQRFFSSPHNHFSSSHSVFIRWNSMLPSTLQVHNHILFAAFSFHFQFFF